VLLFSVALFAGACSMANADNSASHGSTSDGSNTGGGPAGYKKGAVFSIYNAGLPDFPDTTITLSVGANFTGGTGTFKSDVNDLSLSNNQVHQHDDQIFTFNHVSMFFIRKFLPC